MQPIDRLTNHLPNENNCHQREPLDDQGSLAKQRMPFPGKRQRKISNAVPTTPKSNSIFRSNIRTSPIANTSSAVKSRAGCTLPSFQWLFGISITTWNSSLYSFSCCHRWSADITESQMALGCHLPHHAVSERVTIR